MAAALVVGLLVVVAAVPWLWPPRRLPVPRPAQERRAVRVDAAVACELVAAVLDAGAAVPTALDALGRAIDGDDGRALRSCGGALLLGASWSEAWSGVPGRWAIVERALEPAWTDGVAPGPALRAAADGVRARRAELAKEAAARLGVRLVLPLGLCYLPAFVLLGLLPVVIATGGSLLGG
ncbi:type II secretion system protein [Beutenbergia cavernae DSM 12333]|uniref:Type II secretion system protein n=1 Tax=Beutenbergia cavernae (strain ATCC BAA-8 / DSM 12333 / CCUG 43141 / JCM 11478 / NBRC 16432 / NCIMB 13614 / HKI 0122) TaxID=471853 RepID=C5BXY9_BEUC1|nr:type II secretion system F family protein [Beutenbergia cavernae]ACQ78883.1 type II secretion system protein [Beutenbergia cavernae DSM 12333]